MDETSSSGIDVHANIGGLKSDMRFHVLGLGPIGQLVAYHLRRTLSPKHGVSLLLKEAPAAKRARDLPLHVEYQGVISTISGFDTESTLSTIFDLRGKRNEKRDTELRNMAYAGSRNRLVLPTRRVREAMEIQKDEEEDTEHHIESLIVACKAQSTLTAIKQVQHRLSPQSTVVLFQNGNLAVHKQLIEDVFTKDAERPHFILVSNTHGAFLKRAPFHVVHAGVGQFRFGIVPDGRRDFEKAYYEDTGRQNSKLNLNDVTYPQDDPQLLRYRSLRNTVAVLQELHDLQPTWESFESMEILLRQKLVVNCVVNPLTALLGCRNGELYENPSANRMANRICKEAAEVFWNEAVERAGPGANPQNVQVPPELTVEKLMNECRRVTRVTAGNISSMLADLRKGNRITEIDFLNGYLMDLANKYKVKVPVNASMVDLVKCRSTIPLDSML